MKSSKAFWEVTEPKPSNNERKFPGWQTGGNILPFCIIRISLSNRAIALLPMIQWRHRMKRESMDPILILKELAPSSPRIRGVSKTAVSIRRVKTGEKGEFNEKGEHVLTLPLSSYNLAHVLNQNARTGIKLSSSTIDSRTYCCISIEIVALSLHAEGSVALQLHHLEQRLAVDWKQFVAVWCSCTGYPWTQTPS